MTSLVSDWQALWVRPTSAAAGGLRRGDAYLHRHRWKHLRL